MECKLCNITKLPNEFPPEKLTAKCAHPPLACLRCTVSRIEKVPKCPYPNCSQAVNMSDKRVKLFQATLRERFKEYKSDDSSTIDVDVKTTKAMMPSFLTTGTLTITLLTGESMTVPFNPQQQVLDLKRQVSKQMSHPMEKQKLLYNEKELKDYVDDRQSRLADFGCKPNSTLCLVVLLYAVPSDFDHVVFDLHWGYPLIGMDYLDATCLMFQNTDFVNHADFKHRNPTLAVRHSGDVMDDLNRIGHHTINVKLKALPANLTHLFFTLSAWSSPNISRYPNPSLKFYEAANISKDLCKTTFTHARNSQAVIMCSLSRDSDGQWKLFESGKLSAGNARNYEPLKQTIVQLIQQGF